VKDEKTDSTIKKDDGYIPDVTIPAYIDPGKRSQDSLHRYPVRGEKLPIMSYGMRNDLLAEPSPSYSFEPSDMTAGLTILGIPRGTYTLEDYRALPDDQRMELIDGYFFKMEAPSALHQELLIELAYRFKDYQKKKRPDCRVIPAPFDVQLDRDILTMLQPDISIISDRDRIVPKGCFGAPDFIVEILSGSTRAKDMYLKLAKYKNAGVHEYWMVDPEKHQVLVWDEKEGDRLAVYDLESRIPLGITDGDLDIDFREIMEELSYLQQ
jgi:Uma2 family endonuclease